MPIRRTVIVSVVALAGVAAVVAATRLGGPGRPLPSRGQAATRVDGVTIKADPPWAGRSQWPRRGRIESVTISGRTSGLSAPAYVYLPPQYFQPRYAHARFPAAEVLTGFPGRVADLIQGIGVPAAMLRLIDADHVQPLILVMTRPAVTYPRDTECTDVPSGPQVQTFFASDVPAAIGHAYRARATGWGALGISTGGYCAAKLAMVHPSRFPTAVSISGYPMALRDATTGDLWGGSAARRDHNDLDWRLLHLPAPPVSLLATMGAREIGFDEMPALRRFLRLVKPPMRVSSIVFPGGRHTVPWFARELPVTLTWLCRHLPQGPAQP